MIFCFHFSLKKKPRLIFFLNIVPYYKKDVINFIYNKKSVYAELHIHTSRVELINIKRVGLSEPNRTKQFSLVLLT